MEKVDIICVLNQNGGAIYTMEWVEKLRNMVDRNMNVPYNFVCLTNVDVNQYYSEGREHLTDITFYPLRYNWPGWWSKMEIFSPLLPLNRRILYLDLDILIMDDLLYFLRFPADFAIGSMYGHPDVHRARKVSGVRPGYNSSVMAFDNAQLIREIWDKFNESPEHWMHNFRGDQDFLQEFFPDLDTFPAKWIPKFGQCVVNKEFRLPKRAKIILCMARDYPNKNLDLAQEYFEVDQIWR